MCYWQCFPDLSNRHHNHHTHCSHKNLHKYNRCSNKGSNFYYAHKRHQNNCNNWVLQILCEEKHQQPCPYKNK